MHPLAWFMVGFLVDISYVKEGDYGITYLVWSDHFFLSVVVGGGSQLFAFGLRNNIAVFF